MKSNRVRKFLAMILGLVLVFAWLPMLPAAQAKATTSPVEVWLTDLSRHVFLAPQANIAFTGRQTSSLPTIAVDEERRYQTMVGYGASFTDSSAWLVGTRLPAAERDALMRALFSRNEGISLAMLRQPMGASDFSVTGNYSYDDMPPGQTDPDLSEFSIQHDIPYIIPVLKQARRLNPDLKIVATPWSPPGWMKTSDAMIGGSLKPEAYRPFAQYFARFVQDYKAQGVPIDYITPQNEPLYEPGGYPGMLMKPEDQQVFIRDYVGPALARAHLSTGILAYDHNWDVPGYPETIYSDPQAASQVVGTAWHCYGGDVSAQTAVHNAYPNEETHHTECSGGEWQGTPREAFDGVIGLVINAPRQWARSVVLWNMALDEANGPTNNGCLTCRGVVTIRKVGNSYTYTKNLDYYALGHASKFVRAGATHIGSSTLGAGNVETVAFRNPDGSNVLIAHNSGTTQRTFQVVWGDRSFRYALAPGAAATFKWTGEQHGHTSGYEALARSVDIPFHNPDGSRVLLTYTPEQVNYQHSILAANKAFAYSLPVGASLASGGSEALLPRTGWIATASASASDGPPANALDGKRATRWSLGHGQTNGDWFQVDLGARRTFDGLLVDAADSTGDFVRSYQVYVSNDGRRWDSAIASGPGSGQLLRVVFPTVTARYIRVVSTGNSGNWWSIAEFQVFASHNTRSEDTHSDAGEVQRQLFKTPGGAQGLAVYNPRSRPARFDVKLWADESFVYSLPARAAAIFIWTGPRAEDGLPPAPKTTAIAPSSGLPGTVVELDGTNFGDFQGASTVKFGEAIAPIVAWSNTSISAAVPEGLAAGPLNVSVLVYGLSSNVQPFTVLGLADALPRTGWTATASSSAPGEPPSNALDGNIGSRWSSGTGMTPGMSFQVDMGAPQTFSQVVMDAGESTGDYARGYEVYVSTDGTNWGSSVATGTGNGRIVAARFATQTARYVKVVQTQSSGSWWSIAEFYAFP